MERLHFSKQHDYNAIEAAIHLNRYAISKNYVQGKKVLDVACGEGYGSKLIKQWGAEVVMGVDISQEAINNANKIFAENGLVYMVHSAEHLPFPDDSYDVAVSLETIEHLEHPELFLQELRRVVKPDGVIIVSCPNDPYYSRRVANFVNPYHKKEYDFTQFLNFTCEYLGKEAEWYFGYGAYGFAVVPESKCNRIEENAKDISMKNAMLNPESASDFYCLHQESKITQDNCLYYIGIWGGKNAINSAILTCFPREHLLDSRELYASVYGQVQENLPTILANQAHEMQELAYRNAHLDNDVKICLQTKQENENKIAVLIQQNLEYEALLQQQKQKLNEQVEKNHAKDMHNQRQVVINELIQKENVFLNNTISSLWTEIDTRNDIIGSQTTELEHLHNIENAKSVRILKRYWKFKLKVIHFFRK